MKKLNVLGLGGCGAMGRVAVKTILGFPLINTITIADRDMEKAEAFARECGGKTGVFAPEGGIEPDLFFDTIAPYCKPTVSSGRELVSISKTWEIK